jgi:hypothetical protein
MKIEAKADSPKPWTPAQMPWLDGKTKVGLTVAVPYSGRPTTVEWAFGLALQGWPMNIRTYFSALKGKPIAEARTTLIKKARENNVRYLFFIDDDVVLPVNAGAKLYDTLIKQGPLVKVAAGIYPNRDTDNPEPMIFQGDGNGAFWKWKVGEIFPVSGAGTGCMLIDMSLFDELEEPWFKVINELNYDETDRMFLFDYMTDDLFFCEKVVKAGFQIVCDGGVICAHQNALEGKTYYLPLNSYPFQPIENRPETV